jgi:hypothetical protein
MIYYAGIGNRQISIEVYNLIKRYAEYFNKQGYILRSGGAMGADTAFEEGSDDKNIIYTANHASLHSMDYASNFHPAWDKCNDYARKLHGRNAMIIMGSDLRSPVSFVICYAKDENKGGTSLGIRIARANNIPIINLAKV